MSCMSTQRSFDGSLFSVPLSCSPALVSAQGHSRAPSQAHSGFSGTFHVGEPKRALLPSLFLHHTELMFFYSIRTPINDFEDKLMGPKNRLLSLVFASRPASIQRKFLDFSPNKTRVIADIEGRLPQTQNSASASITTDGDYV